MFIFWIFSKKAVQDVQLEGKVCVLDIDTQGVKQIKQSSLNPIFVFIKPPSIEELEHRLRDRNTETEESLSLRLTAAKEEIEYGEKIFTAFYFVLHMCWKNVQLVENFFFPRFIISLLFYFNFSRLTFIFGTFAFYCDCPAILFLHSLLNFYVIYFILQTKV